MNYGKRINLLCSLIQKSSTFADVGCDHGYCSQYVLEKGLCDKVIISDVSKGSLEKAKTLLDSYLKDGKVTAVLGDGFFGVPKDTEQVLIAGMGGREIIQILSHKDYGFIPGRFVFQPMHDAPKLRRYLLDNGAYLYRDFTFTDGRKYYEVLVGGLTGTEEEKTYTQAQLTFGKENMLMRSSEFLDRLEKEVEKVEKYLTAPSVSEGSRTELIERKALLQQVIDNEIK